MSRSNLLTVLGTATVALALSSAPAGAAGAAAATKTTRLSSGTTTLTLSAASVANLQAAGVTMSGQAPATTVGSKLTFPIASGTVKTKGKKITGGRIVHKGSLAMTRETVSLVLSKPTVVFGAKPVLNGTLGALAVPIGTLSLTKAKLTLTKTTMKISGVSMKLTKLAADAMNAAFAVSNFKAGDDVGTAVISAKVKR